MDPAQMLEKIGPFDEGPYSRHRVAGTNPRAIDVEKVIGPGGPALTSVDRHVRRTMTTGFEEASDGGTPAQDAGR
jgi:hypothetical protein